MSDSFFDINKDGVIVGRDAARGPWDGEACHAGPVAGMLARALEQAVADKQLARLTVEVQRAVPLAGFTIETETGRSGRFLTTASAVLTDTTGKVCCKANSTHIATRDLGDVPTTGIAAPDFEDAKPNRFGPKQPLHAHRYFSDAIEVRYPPGSGRLPGENSMWMKAPPLLADEPLSPFQRVCPIADCCNGLSRNADLTEVRFMNLDLTISLYRPPASDWIGSSATSHWSQDGIGLAYGRLFDQQGIVGLASQSLLLQRA